MIKFPKKKVGKHFVQERSSIADLWECHLLCPSHPAAAIIIESSQKADYHNRHIKRSPGRGLFTFLGEACQKFGKVLVREKSTESLAIFWCAAPCRAKRSLRTEKQPTNLTRGTSTPPTDVNKLITFYL